jgi:hypothetical protein
MDNLQLTTNAIVKQFDTCYFQILNLGSNSYLCAPLGFF